MFRCHVFCCTNLRTNGDARGSCAEKGAEDLRNYMKDRAKKLGLKDTRINSAGCLDQCAQGPAIVVYPEGIWYTARTKEDIDAILDEHLVGGKKVERLLMKKGS